LEMPKQALARLTSYNALDDFVYAFDLLVAGNDLDALLALLRGERGKVGEQVQLVLSRLCFGLSTHLCGLSFECQVAFTAERRVTLARIMDAIDILERAIVRQRFKNKGRARLLPGDVCPNNCARSALP
jgi:hypothetical protein